jgi:hypothetical protein
MYTKMSNSNSPLNVYITVDTETWCGGWNNIDAKFPQAFKNYIYGKTNKGDYGLPFQLKLLNEHGLKAVFFVEPLFSMRFGQSYLDEVVGLVLDANQSVELHVHPEWTDESNSVIFPHIKNKREHLKYFTVQEQTHLLSLGKDLLIDAGCNNVTAFRAGSFGANNDTLRAVEANGLSIDSSYNYCFGENCEISVFDDIQQPVKHNRIIEVPMTTFIDGSSKRRHTQLTACSYAELSSSMMNAYEQNWQSYVLLSHSFELMKPDFSSYDKYVVKRFEKLCIFLADNTDKFQTSFFDKIVVPKDKTKQHLKTGLTPLLKRYYEQSLRKII